jgi:hypothetical protein
MNFTNMRKRNESFTGGAAEWDAYLKWCQEQVCEGCGARYADRPRDAQGKCTDVWFTETLCWSCFSARCA